MAKRLQELPQVTSVLTGSSYILMKDSRNGQPEDFRILVNHFLASKLDVTALNTIGQIPTIDQGVRMVDDGSGDPALPAISGKYLEDLDIAIGNASDTNKGVNFLSDSLTSVLDAATGNTASTPAAAKALNDNKTGRSTDENPTGVWKFNSTGAIKVPSGTTAEQLPSEEGLIRFNKDDMAFEGNDGVAWAAIGGAGGITWETKASNFTIEAKFGYMFSGTDVTQVTLIGSPIDGDLVQFADLNDSWDTNPVNVLGNGKNIEGDTTLSLNIAGGGVTLVYSSTTDQWEIVAVSTGISGPRNIQEQTFASGQTTYSLGWTPASKESLLVLIGNVPQSTNAYTLTGNVLSFSTAPEALVIVRYLGMPLSIGTPSDGTVTTNKVVDGAVTKDKIDPVFLNERVLTAWVMFSGIGSIVINDSYGITSVIDNSVGNYTVNLLQAATTLNYPLITGVGGNGSDVQMQADTRNLTNFRVLGWGSSNNLVDLATASVGVLNGGNS